MSDGAIWKFNPKDGVWTDITPVHPKDTDQPFGYGCVAVDARHPQTLMATTFTHWHPHDEISAAPTAVRAGRSYGTTTPDGTTPAHLTPPPARRTGWAPS